VLTDIKISDPPDFELIPNRFVWEERQRNCNKEVIHG
jgi:hypothetical protein